MVCKALTPMKFVSLNKQRFSNSLFSPLYSKPECLSVELIEYVAGLG